MNYKLFFLLGLSMCGGLIAHENELMAFTAELAAKEAYLNCLVEDYYLLVMKPQKVATTCARYKKKMLQEYQGKIHHAVDSRTGGLNPDRAREIVDQCIEAQEYALKRDGSAVAYYRINEAMLEKYKMLCAQDARANKEHQPAVKDARTKQYKTFELAYKARFPYKKLGMQCNELLMRDSDKKYRASKALLQHVQTGYERRKNWINRLLANDPQN